jgi:hypothetical protein
MREAREAMLLTVAAQLREDPASLGVLEFEPVTWRDRCLEIERLATCERERTAGYRLRLRRRGGLYEYRTAADRPTEVALAAAPDPAIGEPALAWRWPAGPGGCRTLLIAADGRPAIGWCDGPIAEVEWLPELFSRQEWEYFHSRFSPFALTNDGHTIAFGGRGSAPTPASWQLAIARWAALRWAELDAGRSGAAHGRALAYRKPRRDPAVCDVLELTEYGVAYAGAANCAGGGGETGRTAWLSDSLWEEMSGWLEDWSAYSDDAAGLQFFGRGERPLEEEDARLLVAWSEQALVHVSTSAFEAWEVGDSRMRTR